MAKDCEHAAEVVTGPFNVDAAVNATYGSGRYAWRLAFVIGGLYTFGCCYQQMWALVNPKFAANQEFPAFTEKSITNSQSLLFLGFAVGNLIAPAINDSMGRYLTVFLLACSLFISIILAVISPNSGSVPFYAAMIFLEGAFFTTSICGYVFLIENLPDEKKGPFTVTLNISCSVWLGLMAIIFGYVTDKWSWQAEGIAWAIPEILFAALGFLTIYESPKFLAAKGRWSDAMAVFCKIAATNGVELKPEQQAEFAVIQVGESTAEKPPPTSALRALCNPTIIIRILLCTTTWIACSCGYFGLTYSAGNLSPYMHLNIVFMAIADCIGYILPLWLLPRFGLLRTQMMGFGVATICLGVCALISPGSKVLVALAIFGRLFVDIAFTTVYMLSAECFPTECRTTAVGLANFIARVVSLGVPMLSRLPSQVSCPILAALCAVATAATMFLPDVDGLAKATKKV